MIISMNGTTRMEGTKNDVLAEVTCILHAVYEQLKKREGEQSAMEQLAEIGRLAVMTEEELDEATKNLLNEILNN